ncbi:carboxypeptidase regulatory-like domain-containing protein [Brevibacillus nitrificans]|uniref:carboxypeptidase regulatory-like domain-containing protein n=1 Tax=Brevibacillus nitrificans TaxID=651560 RepID=UPI0026198DBE|nr:carboxypeptidase regulatory-like domain-containing protein [Brevibacillus nitrificans]MED1796757.1 carboxypeptidase regulatory-like domain-containing protein [Brevibacillus nitrificans]
MAYPADNQFIPFSLGGVAFGDVPKDESPGGVDLVGDATFPVAFLAYDGTTLYFRMRVNEDPRNSQKTGFQNYSWGYLINTNGVAGTYQWMLGVQGLRNRIALIQNTIVEVNSWNDPAEGTNGSGAPNWQAPIINFDTARVRVTGDGSNFSGNPDYFIDLVMPAAVFFSTMSVNSLTGLKFIPYTSANDNNYNKDSLRTSEGFSFTDAFSNTSTVASGDVRASLAVDKQLTSGPVGVTTGQISQWTGSIAVSNPGKSQANSVVVNDQIELDQVTAFAVNTISTGTVAYNPLTKVLSWTIGNLAAGAAATLAFSTSGVFHQTTGGSRRLNTAVVSGVDSFIGGKIAAVQDDITLNVVPSGSVAGIVIDQSTNIPLAGVTVQLYDSNPVLIGTTTSDANGAYSFTGLTPAEYSLVATLATYDQKIQFVTVSPGLTTTSTILLSPTPGSVSGTVTDQGTFPIPGALVKLVNGAGVTLAQTTTGALGNYQFLSVAPGTYTVTVSADTFQSDTAAILVNKAQTTIYQVVLQSSSATLSGTVTGPGSVPLPGALVDVLNQTGIPVTETLTDALGNYLLNNLAPGIYQIRVSAAGFSSQLAGVSLEAGDSKNLSFHLSALPGTVSGTITDAETLAEIPNSSVKILTNEGIAVRSTTTDVSGDYTISSLPAGTYVLVVSAQGYASKTIGIQVTAGGTTTADLSLDIQAGVLNGTVTDAGMSSIAGALVVAFKGTVPVAQALTDGSGSFSFSHLAPGTYFVTVSADTYATAVLGATVFPLQTTTLSFVLPSTPGALAGQVVDSSNLPVQGAIVTVRDNTPAGAVIANVLTDGNGEYQVPGLQPQSYAITVSATEKVTYTTGAIILPGATTTRNVQLADLPGTLLGTILDATSGLPIMGANIEVSIRNTAGVVVASTYSDPSGNYLVAGLAPGSYTVTVNATNYQSNSASANVVANGSTSVSLSLFPSPGEIQGLVLAQGTFDPVPGAQVNAVDSNGALVKSTLSDNQGNFQFTGLGSGHYIVVASASGFQTSQTGANVLANTATNVQIVLTQDFGAISGTISPVVPGTIVQLFDINNVLIASRIAEGSGVFTFAGIAPGSYLVTAAAEGYSVQSVGTIVLSGNTSNVSLTMIPTPASIAGTVVDSGLTPISTATVRVLDANETTLGFGYTDAAGSYSIGNLPAGAFTVVATSPGYASASVGVQLALGEAKTGLDFVLAPNSGGISGHISNAASPGSSIVGASILVRSVSNGNVAASANSDSNGNYVLESLTPGAYTVVVSAPGFAAQSIGVNVVSGDTTDASGALLPLPGKITGVVINSLGNPVTGSNINVKLLDSNQVVLQSLLASENGVFAFENVSSGAYTLLGTAPGYGAGSIGVIVIADTVSNATVPLQDLPAAISGQVTNQSTAVGIPGSRVLITDAQGLLITQVLTDAQGTFLVENLPPKVINVTVSAPNFSSASQSVLLQPGQTASFQQALTPDPGALAGTVTDLNTGMPITGATVIVYDNTRAPVVTVLTDANGNYGISNLAPGIYTVNTNAAGYASDAAGAEILSDSTSLLSFALNGLPGAIIGTVRDQNSGLPVSGATITVRQGSPSGTIMTILVANDQGMYAVGGLSPGSYTLIASSPFYAAEVSTTLVGQGATTVLDFSLPLLPAGVTGVVTDVLVSIPLVNTLVRLLDNNNAILFSSQTDAQGNYLINGFEAGNYTLLVRNESYQRKNVSFAVGAGATALVDVQLDPNPGTLRGVVVDAFDGTPLVGADVLIYFPSTNNLLARTITDGLGQFVIEGLAPLTYTLAISMLNYATQVVGATIFSGMTTTIAVGLPPNPATITGQVQTENGAAIPNASVQVKDVHGTLFGSAVTDDLGNYSIANLPPGTYIVSATEPNYATAMQSVTVVAGQTIIGLTLTMGVLPGRIAGVVLNQGTGFPITGAAVAIQIYANGIFIANTVTDNAGQFLVSGLKAGVYNVIASADGFGTSYRTVTVQSNQTANTSVSLSSLVGDISGIVLLPDGTQARGNNIQLALFDANGIRLQNILAQPDGTFRFVNVAPETYRVEGHIPGIGMGSTQAIVLANQTTFIVVQLAATGRLQGTVRSAVTGLPLPNAMVTVQYNQQPVGIVARVQTDALGRFFVPDLAPGSYLVVASAAGYAAEVAGTVVEAGSTAMLDFVLRVQNATGCLRVRSC